MEFHIAANTCEDADKQINEIMKGIWHGALHAFAQSNDEEMRLEIVKNVIRRGCVPFHLDQEEHTVYNAMKENISAKKIASHKAIGKIDITHTR